MFKHLRALLLEVLQSYILSTTTETFNVRAEFAAELSFNRTSFQQQLKLIVVIR